mmetsp:Transcript_29804/g.69179  ORF Transcript_29804/g.69179 Transcript_29804/m.69179 type:complete len:266 (+) Transcript_29804:5617-6414(+)
MRAAKCWSSRGGGGFSGSASSSATAGLPFLSLPFAGVLPPPPLPSSIASISAVRASSGSGRSRMRRRSSVVRPSDTPADDIQTSYSDHCSCVGALVIFVGGAAALSAPSASSPARGLPPFAGEPGSAWTSPSPSLFSSGRVNCSRAVLAASTSPVARPACASAAATEARSERTGREVVSGRAGGSVARACCSAASGRSRKRQSPPSPCARGLAARAASPPPGTGGGALPASVRIGRSVSKAAWAARSRRWGSCRSTPMSAHTSCC